MTEAEVAAVSKQTSETLMAGEKIMEALDLADTERESMREYTEAMAQLSEDDAMRMQPPARNPVLAAYDLEPEAWVLRVVEKIPSTSLQDALLVLPFGKVVSLMVYLNIWAQKVCMITLHGILDFHAFVWIGLEYHSCIEDHFLPAQDSPSSNSRQSHHENYFDPSAKAFADNITTTEECYWLQPGCTSIYP